MAHKKSQHQAPRKDSLPKHPLPSSTAGPQLGEELIPTPPWFEHEGMQGSGGQGTGSSPAWSRM